MTVADTRQDEGRLFGSAADGTGVKSLVRLRLDRWDKGKMTSWPKDPEVVHPEVKGGKEVGSHLYLGYGPLNFNRGTYLGRKQGREFKPSAAIQAGEEATLKLAFPEPEATLLNRALACDEPVRLAGRSFP